MRGNLLHPTEIQDLNWIAIEPLWDDREHICAFLYGPTYLVGLHGALGLFAPRRHGMHLEEGAHCAQESLVTEEHGPHLTLGEAAAGWGGQGWGGQGWGGQGTAAAAR